MEYIYTAMLIHKLGHKIDEHNVRKVLEAAGAKVDDMKIKALVAALSGVDIDKAIKEAAMPAAAPVAAAHAAPVAEKKKEEPKVSEEAAAAGLGALFG